MTPKEFEIMLSDAEIQLSRIKHLYEQWFQGIERIEPQIPRKQFDRSLHALRKETPRNTALRFRFQTLIQRYTTLQTYWRRIGRQIEEGTYRRDLLRARRRREAGRAEREQERLRRSSRPVQLDPDADVNMEQLIAEASDRIDELKHAPAVAANAGAADAEETTTTLQNIRAQRARPPAAQKPQAPAARFSKPKSKRPVAAKETPSTASSANRRAPPEIASRSKGPGEARMRQIYDNYVEAKRSNNERTDKIDYERVAKSLKKMVPVLDRKHKGKRIDFKVVVKDGKVGIKPVVKK
ncbi:MAG: MXAN_5187 C-terminal domain-containing protein [Polyangiales bacterium]